MADFNRTDLEFILTQIEMAEAGQQAVSPNLSFGLREVSGTNNNLVTGQSTFGAADQVFPRATQAVFQTVSVNVDGTAFDPHPGVEGDVITTSYQQVVVDPAAQSLADAGIVVDTAPRTVSNLVADQSSANPAAVAAAETFRAQLGTGYQFQITTPSDGSSLFIGNITPDAGLSAPFNTWMTLFGQFFDHGLDLVTKGGSGTVFIPLQPDDPLLTVGPDGIAGSGDEVDPRQAFMVLTRATNDPGADGVLGTADDIHANTNTITPFVDQNQTYTSSPSHQVFLRSYVTGSDGLLHTTGHLLNGRTAGADGTLGTADDIETLPTWADVKANALKLGIKLTDKDVGNVPLLATDAYGNFIAGPNGFAQVVVKRADGTMTLVEGTANGLNLDDPLPGQAGEAVVRTGHAFLNDIAHTAVPVLDQSGNLLQDGDVIAGNVDLPIDAQGHLLAYDDELLDAHYIAGDGRANENIGLTAVHEVFHDEHNRLVEQIKQIVLDELAKGDTAFASQWVLPGVDVTQGISDADWNGERLFQAAKFGTETQYQHLVFEEFARKISPTIHLFGNVDINLDPAITAEFAHAVYRFGHSMLDESLPMFEVDPATGRPAIDPITGQPKLTDMGLIEAFLNPLAYANGVNTAGQIVLGTTQQIGSEIDEFVTGALRNNLLGLPLDLAALNIARGRETGVAPLNVLRNELYTATNDVTLKPYESWHEFGQFLKHPLSLINFVAAYATHPMIAGADGLEGKRQAALALVTMGENEANRTAVAGSPERDAYDFMHSLGAYANDKSNPIAVQAQWSTGNITGLDTVDLWIGGLAEKQNLNGGLLGSTFNFIFETQLEKLQDGDRLYYLPRIEGLHWGSEIEANSFAEMIQRNLGVKHLPGSIFSTPEYTVEAGAVTDDQATWLRNPETGEFLVQKLNDAEVQALIAKHSVLNTGVPFDTQVRFIGDDNFLGNTIVLGGTSGRDVLIAGQADTDTVWGDEGDDYIDGGGGDDILFGGDGNDVIADTAGLDTIHGDKGDDWISAGIGDDIVFGGDGNDWVDGGAGIDIVSGGEGDDVLHGGEDADEVVGNEGDDWVDGGAGGDLVIGDQGAPTGMMPLITGNDVLVGGADGDKMMGFNGDDIMLGEGGLDNFLGGNGYDWASFETEKHGVSVDMNRAILVADPAALGGDAFRDTFAQTEAVSGSKYDDVLLGTDVRIADPFNVLENVTLIKGLPMYFPEAFPAGGLPSPVAFSDGNIMLGGDGSDRIMGRGGNDIIDGDAYLHVALSQDAAGGIITREIRYDTTAGDIDTAIYADVQSNYTVSFKTDANGAPILLPNGSPVIIVTHNAAAANNGGNNNGAGQGLAGNLAINDGIDTLYNIERIEFADGIWQNPYALTLNSIPTGQVLIDGDTNAVVPGVDPLVGALLRADLTAPGVEVSDADGIVDGTLKYQWQYQEPIKGAWVNITGANAAEYTPTSFVSTFPLRLEVSYVDGLGFHEVMHSAATNPVAFGIGVNTPPVVRQQQGTIGFANTSATQGEPMQLYLALTNAFNDQQTPAGQLRYKAELVTLDPITKKEVAHALDGSEAANHLTFAVIRDVTGAVAGGAITGTPTLLMSGDMKIRVSATDTGPGTPLTTTTTFSIHMIPGNVAPVATADGFDAVEDETLVVSAAGGVLANDHDPDGNQITASVVATTQHGLLSFNADGSFTYTPDAGYAGPDGFTYQVSDGALVTGPVSVSIDVAPVQDGTAALVISGIARSGETLTAILGEDPDGAPVGTVTFTWYRDGQVVDGVTGDTLVLAAGDAGHRFWVSASYVDAQGFPETATASATDIVGLVARAANGNSTLNGTAGADILTGSAGANTIRAGAGDDIIDAGAGRDAIFGEAGNDTITHVLGQGPDAVSGGADDDTLRIIGSQAAETVTVTLNAAGVITRFVDASGTNTLTGIEHVVLDMGAPGAPLANRDLLSYGTTAVGVTVDLGLGTASGFDAIADVESVLGGNAGDAFWAAVNAVRNVFDGGAGADTVDYSRYTAGLSVTLAGSTLAIVQGTGPNNAGSDQIRNVENVVGGAGNDTLTGDGANNALTGGSGDDGLFGGDGADTLVGGSGRDTLSGGRGADRLDGGWDADTLTGGNGVDTFVFATGYGKDVITDFRNGTDVIELSMGLGFDTFGEVRSAAKAVAGGVQITFDADTTLTLQGFTLASLSADDFRFV